MPAEPRADRVFTAFFEQPFPPDLLIAAAWLAAAVLSVYLPVISASPLRVALALPVVLFLPGYCLIAALFPGNGDIDLIERVALSFGLSIAVVPLIGLALNFTPWGIRLDPVVTALSAFTVAMVLIAHYRRAILPAEERFFVPFRETVAGLKQEFAPESASRTDRVLNAVLLFAIVAAVVTTVCVIAVPKEGEHFTEFYVLGEKMKAADYPDRIRAGEGHLLFIGVGNHEYRTVTYTVETCAMDLAFDDAANTSRLLAMEPLFSRTLTLAHNETATFPYTLSVPGSRYNRIEFLLFNETVPGPDVTGLDRVAASYRDLHLWVTVRDS